MAANKLSRAAEIACFCNMSGVCGLPPALKCSITRDSSPTRQAASMSLRAKRNVQPLSRVATAPSTAATHEGIEGASTSIAVHVAEYDGLPPPLGPNSPSPDSIACAGSQQPAASSLAVLTTLKPQRRMKRTKVSANQTKFGWEHTMPGFVPALDPWCGAGCVGWAGGGRERVLVCW